MPKATKLTTTMRVHHADLTDVMHSNNTSTLRAFLHSSSPANTNHPTVAFARKLQTICQLYRSFHHATWPHPENRVVLDLERVQGVKLPGEDGHVIQAGESAFEYFGIVGQEVWASKGRVKEMVKEDQMFKELLTVSSLLPGEDG